jgi:hypothetical protein
MHLILAPLLAIGRSWGADKVSTHNIQCIVTIKPCMMLYYAQSLSCNIPRSASRKIIILLMLNNFIYYYVLNIITLISLFLLIKLSKYLDYFIRNRYFYSGYYCKIIDPRTNYCKLQLIFTPRCKETIFNNYFNMLKILQQQELAERGYYS